MEDYSGQANRLEPQPGNQGSAQELLYFGFNQDYGCFAVGTSTGFRVYNCDPYRETFRREFNNGGVGVVEMLFRCNILAFVGGGRVPLYPPNKVMIWDDHQARCIGELSFRSQVRAVKLRRDRIVVALEHKVLAYKFADLRLLHSIETFSNPRGLMALSAAAEQTVLACPGQQSGQVRVELYDVRRTKFILAHTSSLACIALSLDGKLLATASEKGTLIRVHCTSDGAKLQELRRGADPASVCSIAFSRGPAPQWLAVSSDKGTVHIFSLSGGNGTNGAARGGVAAADNDESSPTKNPVSALSFVSSFLPVPYFASERSFAQFRLPGESPEERSVVGFGQAPNTLVVLTASGSFYTATFKPDAGGICEQKLHFSFADLGTGS